MSYMGKNDERKPFGTQVVSKAIKIKYIHFFSFYFHYKAPHASSAKRLKVNILPTGETDLREEVVRKSMTPSKSHSTNFRLKRSPSLYGWLYQLMGRAG